MPGKISTSMKRASTLVTLLLFGLISTIGGWLLGQPSTVHAEGLLADQPGPTFTVNTTADDALDAGCTDTHCTLREAITAANTATGANKILFAVGDNQTITLTSALPAISDTSGALTIDGETHSPVLSGNNQFRGFTVNNNVQFTLAQMTIKNGNYTGGDCGLQSCGGGLKVEAGATATLTDVVIQNSTAGGSGGAIYNFGTANLARVTLQGSSANEGGGILNGGTLNISNSLLKGNSALYGGGILIVNSGAMTAENSTFSGNTATGEDIQGGGGAVDIYSGSATFNFCTIAYNTAISPNQPKSGIWLEDGTVSLQNSIVSNNNGANNLYRASGTFTSNGYNIASAWNGLTTTSTDLTGDPKLTALADNGGSTFTHALSTGSPAINAANPAACLSADQRGISRRSGACDIGAYELLSAPTDISLSASNVTENAPAGAMVGMFSTTDPDTGDTFTYSLVTGAGGADNGSFILSGNTLLTSVPFDYEAKSSYSIRVRTTDQDGLWVEEPFTITVTNVSETPTDISLSASNVTENAPAGATVGMLSTTDPDTGNTFTYTLVTGAGGADNGSFILSGNTLFTSVPFNYEAKSSYSIRVRTTDPGALYYDEQFTITVTNVNETPTDISLSATTVAENEAINTSIGTLSTTDPDSGNTFTYSLVTGAGGADNASFNLSGNSLLTAALFDYETKNSYSIRVRTTDQGGLWVEEPFTIAVTNVNETSTGISLTADSVAENAAENTAIGTLSTTDPDGDGIFSYSLVSGSGGVDNTSFNISGDSLKTSSLFDYETKNSYSIRVRTTDQDGLWVEEPFTITVTNVNETPTDISLSATRVAEDAAISTVIGTLSTTDPDNGNTFIYTLASGAGGADNASFNISGNNLLTAALFDFETKNSYAIRVRTTDQDGLWVEEPFTITITDANLPPTDINLSAGSVAENAAADTVVGTLSTTDPDSGNTFTYTLSSGAGSADNASFNISDASLRASASFDYETKNSYSIRVRATDQGGLWVEEPFTITVTDSPSDFSLSNTHVTTAQSIVGTLSTVGEGVQYTYTLQTSGPICGAANGADNSRFRVDGNALRRLATTLGGTYHICLQTEDAHLEVLQKSYTIDVTASASQPSTWTTELTSNKVIDGDPTGTLVGTVVSSVADTTFKLTDPAIFPLNSAFHLSSDGFLTLAVSANIHLQQNYPIRILATAPDGSTLIIDALIQVMKDGEDAGAAAGDDHGEVVEGGVIEVDVLANDAMSSGAASWKTHEIVRYPDHGTARIGSILYSPNSGYAGTDTITYRACDNLDFCVVGELTLTVRAFSASQTDIPNSGFSPNKMTTLPEMPATLVYSDAGDLDLSIPGLGVHAPVVGIPLTTTGWDISWLGNQVGWLNGSAFPTLNGNSVLTGHVYTADGAPGIFMNLSQLRWGDEVIIRVDDQSYVYEVRQVIDHVDPSDVETLMAHKDTPWLSLVTCQGYDEETHTYQWRYIVRAVLTKIE